MRICNLTGSQYQEFLEFNREIYPDRKDVEERFRLQVLDNPFVEDASTSNVLLAYNTEGKMVGQFIIYPCEYHFGGKLLRCFFGSDLFVLEEYRHKGLGRFLTSRAINDFKPHFSIDISETAKKIFLALKAQIIGNMQKYLWLSRTTAALRCIFRAAWRHEHVQFRDYEFPRKLSGEGYTFNLVRFLENWENPNWHENILEFSRSQAFLGWRFLKKPDRYHFYLSDCSSKLVYFVVRKAVWAGMSLLVIVDHRVPFREKKSFQSILTASKSLAKASGCDGIVTMSSHVFFDEMLRKAIFLKVGRPALILTNAKLDVPSERITARDFVYATMADGDIDLNYYPTPLSI